MSMVVQHNLSGMNANRMLGITTDAQAKSTEKLSSGYKINRAADDAAGLVISEKMRSQIRGLTQASANAQDGISLIQTAEGALSETHDMLQRMNELAVKAGNGVETSKDRNAIQEELNSLQEEITRIATTTKFNTKELLQGSLKDMKFFVGNENGSKDVITLKIDSMTSSALKVSSVDIKDVGGTKARQLITKITHAIATVSAQRSRLGAVQNRLEHTVRNLDNVVENTQSAESRIRDTDMPTEMVNYSKNNILAQAGQSMLAQANQSNQGVLSILG